MKIIDQHKDDQEMTALRCKIQQEITNQFVGCCKELMKTQGYEEEAFENCAQVLPIGSLALGYHLSSSDMDLLCVTSKHIERRDFETVFSKNLFAIKEVTALKLMTKIPRFVIEYATGQKMEIDVLFSRLTKETCEVDEITAHDISLTEMR